MSDSAPWKICTTRSESATLYKASRDEARLTLTIPGSASTFPNSLIPLLTSGTTRSTTQSSVPLPSLDFAVTCIKQRKPPYVLNE